MYRELTARIEQLPGVRSASFARETFFGGSASRGNIAYEGQTGEAPQSEWPFKPLEQQPPSRRGDLQVRSEGDPRVMAAQVQEAIPIAALRVE